MNEVTGQMGTTVKNNSSSFTGANTHNVDDEVSTSFLNLLPEIKRMILKKLNLSSRYNLCVVWKDMENEFWKPIDIKKRWLFITTLEDFELAGVLASAGYVDTVKSLLLVRVDVFDIPSNIINNLVKIVKETIILQKVTGWSTSMLSDVKCKYLSRIEIHGMWSYSDSKSWANARGWKVRKDILWRSGKNIFNTGQVISFTNSKK